MNNIPYLKPPIRIQHVGSYEIADFMAGDEKNIDHDTVDAFGDEWTKFNFFDDDEIRNIASTHYFDIVKPEWIKNKKVLDVGCGTGRWTKFVSENAYSVDAIDPSRAIESAAILLKECKNVRLSKASVDNLPFADESFDLVFSLGVLHHIPNTSLALSQCVKKLAPGGYFLVYLYYKLDQRNLLFKSVFHASNFLRRLICQLPDKAKNAVCDIIAGGIYMPFIGVSKFFKIVGLQKISKSIPLHFYVGKTFNVIRNDARDRFGTPLEQRFSKEEIKSMMENAGLSNIIFSENEPYWHAIGQK